MLTQENEYYIRLILLLLRGGTQALKQTFLKKLADQGSQLNGFLQCNKETITNLKEGKVLTLKQYNILFPMNDNETKICEWDISLISCLLLNLFAQSLQKSEEKAIEHIRTFRNDFAAHHPDGCMDARTFFRKWNQLSTLIINLGNGLSSTERSDLVELIKCVGEDPIDIKHAIQDIKDATGTMDQFMEHVSQLLEHLSITVQQFSSRQDEMSTVLQDIHTDIKELKKSNRGISTAEKQNPDHAITGKELEQEETQQVSRLETYTEKEVGGAMSKVSLEETSIFFDKKEESVLSALARKFTSKFSRGQSSYKVAIELLETQYEFVAFVLYDEMYFDEMWVESFVFGELNTTLQRLSGFSRELLCTELRFECGTLILDEYVKYLERSGIVIATVSNQMERRHLSMLKDADAFGKKIVPLVYEGEDFQESVLKGFTNLSTVRLVLEKKNGKYTLSTKLEEFCRSIITLIASPGERVMSYDRKYRTMSGESAVGKIDSMEARPFLSCDTKIFTVKSPKDQPLENFIKLLKEEENVDERVAFLFHEQEDEAFKRDFIPELNETLKTLTGIDKKLIYSIDDFAPRTFGNYEKYLKRSAVLIVVCVNIEMYRHYLKLPDDLEMDIVPMVFEGNEKFAVSCLKGIRNLSKVRIVCKSEKGKYILKTSWRQVGKDILELAASSKHANDILRRMGIETGSKVQEDEWVIF